MTAEQFCYWLQGFIELQDTDKRARPAGLTEDQRSAIRDHLKFVFEKKTPDRSGGGNTPKVLTEDDMRRIMIETRPGFTCSNGPMPIDKYSDWGGKH